MHDIKQYTLKNHGKYLKGCKIFRPFLWDVKECTDKKDREAESVVTNATGTIKLIESVNCFEEWHAEICLVRLIGGIHLH